MPHGPLLKSERPLSPLRDEETMSDPRPLRTLDLSYVDPTSFSASSADRHTHIRVSVLPRTRYPPIHIRLSTRLGASFIPHCRLYASYHVTLLSLLSEERSDLGASMSPSRESPPVCAPRLSSTTSAGLLPRALPFPALFRSPCCASLGCCTFFEGGYGLYGVGYASWRRPFLQHSVRFVEYCTP